VANDSERKSSEKVEEDLRAYKSSKMGLSLSGSYGPMNGTESNHP
jgi:hypothetical protein